MCDERRRDELRYQPRGTQNPNSWRRHPARPRPRGLGRSWLDL